MCVSKMLEDCLENFGECGKTDFENAVSSVASSIEYADNADWILTTCTSNFRYSTQTKVFKRLKTTRFEKKRGLRHKKYKDLCAKQVGDVDCLLEIYYVHMVVLIKLCRRGSYYILRLILQRSNFIFPM